MTRARIIDIIKASGAGPVRVDSKAGYKDTYVIADLTGKQFITKDMYNSNLPVVIDPFVYNIPLGTPTPILIDFDLSEITFGGDPPVSTGTILSPYQSNPDIKFEEITDPAHPLITKQIPAEPVITSKEWFDNSYTTLVKLTLQPDTNTGMPGGVTISNINIIIKV